MTKRGGEVITSFLEALRRPFRVLYKIISLTALVSAATGMYAGNACNVLTE